jgi:hypothetical protein
LRVLEVRKFVLQMRNVVTHSAHAWPLQTTRGQMPRPVIISNTCCPWGEIFFVPQCNLHGCNITAPPSGIRRRIDW